MEKMRGAHVPARCVWGTGVDSVDSLPTGPDGELVARAARVLVGYTQDGEGGRPETLLCVEDPRGPGVEVRLPPAAALEIARRLAEVAQAHTVRALLSDLSNEGISDAE